VILEETGLWDKGGTAFSSTLGDVLDKPIVAGEDGRPGVWAAHYDRRDCHGTGTALVDFIKMDIEGAGDQGALRAPRQLLGAGSP